MKKFNELTLKGQKMRIVRDAIQQIKAGVVVPEQGHYFKITGRRDRPDLSWREALPSKNLQKLFLKDQVECTACAKGSLFAGCVLNVNKVKTDDYLDSEDLMKTKLRKWFSLKELDIIETSFEKGVITDDAGILEKYDNSGRCKNTELGKQAIKFGRKYREPKARLLAILKNILKNGTFKP